MHKKLQKNFRRNYFCRLCESIKLKKVLDLGKTPLANALSKKIKSKNQEFVVPLGLDFCKNCYHLQLTHIVNPKKMFENYLYVTGTSSETVSHFNSYSKDIKKKLKNYKKVKILDIASNDGTFLKNFISKKYEIFGIDPAKNLNKKIKEKNFKILNGFFSYKKSDEIKKKYDLFDVVTANNVFAHVDNLIDFSKGVKNILNKNGIFIFEVSYLTDVLFKRTFDTIYHEHMSFHSYLPLKIFFENLGMRIYDYKRTKIQGGSIRFYVCLKFAKYKTNKNLNYLKSQELNQFKLNKIITYNNFKNNIEKKKIRVNKLIKKLIHNNYVLAGYGAAAKTTTLLNYYGINRKHFQFIVDDNPLKQNRYVPGTAIPIKNSEFIYESKVDYIFILSWNFEKSIISKHKKFEKNGGVFLNIHLA